MTTEPLSPETLDPDPFRQFERWYEAARDHAAIDLPDATCLSTVDPRGFPSGRFVLVKSWDHEGFVFYTNLESRKAVSLLAHPRAALTFYWRPLRRQLRIEGTTEVVDDAEADAYFRTRPRLSQISAWASHQSAPLDRWETMKARFDALVEEFQGREVPRPPHWGGFRLRPLRFEFWEERANRLHVRFRFVRTAGGAWRSEAVYP